MNEAEKERLIKKDIKSIENRVRSAFNQGYEMGLKEGRSKILNTCEDVISRQYLLDNCVVDKVTMPFVPINRIQEAPSVTPQQMIGQWVWDFKSKVYRCSCCKRFPWRVEYVTDHDEIFEDLTRTNAYKYCPNCGCKMQEVEE